MGGIHNWAGCAAAVLALTCAPPLLAQDAGLDAGGVPTEPAVPPVAPATLVIPRLTEVMIEVVTELSSNINVRGQTFPIRLIMPLIVDGVEVIPAGT